MQIDESNTTRAKKTLLRKKNLRILFNTLNGTTLFAALCDVTFLITTAAQFCVCLHRDLTS